MAWLSPLPQQYFMSCSFHPLVDEGYILWASSLFTFIHHPLALSVFGPYVLLSIHFSTIIYFLHFKCETGFHAYIQHHITFEYSIIFRCADRWEEL